MIIMLIIITCYTARYPVTRFCVDRHRYVSLHHTLMDSTPVKDQANTTEKTKKLNVS